MSMVFFQEGAAPSGSGAQFFENFSLNFSVSTPYSSVLTYLNSSSIVFKRSWFILPADISQIVTLSFLGKILPEAQWTQGIYIRDGIQTLFKDK